MSADFSVHTDFGRGGGRVCGFGAYIVVMYVFQGSEDMGVLRQSDLFYLVII